MLLKSRASLTCFRACFLPGRAKDLSAPRYSFSIEDKDVFALPKPLTTNPETERHIKAELNHLRRRSDGFEFRKETFKFRLLIDYNSFIILNEISLAALDIIRTKKTVKFQTLFSFIYFEKLTCLPLHIMSLVQQMSKFSNFITAHFNSNLGHQPASEYKTLL